MLTTGEGHHISRASHRLGHHRPSQHEKDQLLCTPHVVSTHRPHHTHYQHNIYPPQNPPSHLSTQGAAHASFDCKAEEDKEKDQVVTNLSRGSRLGLAQ